MNLDGLINHGSGQEEHHPVCGMGEKSCMETNASLRHRDCIMFIVFHVVIVSMISEMSTAVVNLMLEVVSKLCYCFFQSFATTKDVRQMDRTTIMAPISPKHPFKVRSDIPTAITPADIDITAFRSKVMLASVIGLGLGVSPIWTRRLAHLKSQRG